MGSDEDRVPEKELNSVNSHPLHLKYSITHATSFWSVCSFLLTASTSADVYIPHVECMYGMLESDEGS